MPTGLIRVGASAGLLYIGADLFAFEAALLGAVGWFGGSSVPWWAQGAADQFVKSGPRSLAVLLLGSVFARRDKYVAVRRQLRAGKLFQPFLRRRRQAGYARGKAELHGGGDFVDVLPAVSAAPDEFFL